MSRCERREEGRQDPISFFIFRLEMDEGALSGKQLSLLNYTLIPLAKPKKVWGEIPQQGPISYPLFNKAHFGGHLSLHRSGSPDPPDYVAWPLVIKNSKEGSVRFLDVRFSKKSPDECRGWVFGKGGIWYVKTQCNSTKGGCFDRSFSKQNSFLSALLTTRRPPLFFIFEEEQRVVCSPGISIMLFIERFLLSYFTWIVIDFSRKNVIYRLLVEKKIPFRHGMTSSFLLLD